MNYLAHNNSFSSFGGIHYGTFGLLIPFVILDLVLRGLALWKSAKRNQNIWFIALLIVNTMGILPGIYLLLNRDSKEPPKRDKKSK